MKYVSVLSVNNLTGKMVDLDGTMLELTGTMVDGCAVRFPSIQSDGVLVLKS